MRVKEADFVKLGTCPLGYQYKQYTTEAYAKISVASGRGDDKAMRSAMQAEKAKYDMDPEKFKKSGNGSKPWT